MSNEDKPKIKTEILRAEDIKSNIRETYRLPEAGIVIKTSTKTSPSFDKYELVNSPFFEQT